MLNQMLTKGSTSYNSNSKKYFQRDIDNDPIFNFGAAILRNAHDEYVSALETLMELRNKQHLSKKDGLRYKNALKEKAVGELFYKGERFKMLTMGMAGPANEIIAKMQKEAGYEELN